MQDSGKRPTQYDVAILGGGVIGLSTALGLVRAGFTVALFDRVGAPEPSSVSSKDEQRSFALSPSSVEVFSALGIWQALLDLGAISRIARIHVSEKGSWGALRLSAQRIARLALGHVVPAVRLGSLLWEKLSGEPKCHLFIGNVVQIERAPRRRAVLVHSTSLPAPIRASLLVVADGGGSGLCDGLGFVYQQRTLGESAIVTTLGTTLAHEETAYERFSTSGLMALLPLASPRQMGLVYVVPDADVKAHLQENDTWFLARVMERFGRRLGALHGLGLRRSHPLIEALRAPIVTERAVALGNGANTIHPNGAQGLNLGLRDVAWLVQALRDARENASDIGAVDTLAGYAALRRSDQKRTVAFSRTLFHASHAKFFLARTLRAGALLALDGCPALTDWLVNTASGFSTEQCDWVYTGLDR